MRAVLGKQQGAWHAHKVQSPGWSPKALHGDTCNVAVMHQRTLPAGVVGPLCCGSVTGRLVCRRGSMTWRAVKGSC